MEWIYKNNIAIGAVDETYSKKGTRYTGVLLRTDNGIEKEFNTKSQARNYVKQEEIKYQLSIKNQSKMAKKATPAQLAARKRFTEMAKNGTLAKKRGLKAPAKKKSSKSARSLCRQVIDVPGINKRTGQLLKGWHYVNGKPAKVTAKKKTVAKKKPTTAKKKTTTKKRTKFLGIF